MRFVASDGLALALELLASLQQATSEELVDLRVYQNSSVGSDLSVHLHHCSDTAPDSSTGRRLARELQAFGLTDRTLWLEVRPTESED